ncbi:MAG: glycosyltransferase family 4 protein [Flavobacteriales bacterium]|nr:glycosyltransferase family 4 protein [Flavobacteriales bacterium]
MKRVLIITYYWPPSGGAGVQRWLKFVKYLPEFGWQPVVYTPENPEFPALDESLEQDIPNGIEVIKQPIWEPYNWYRQFLGQKDKKIGAGFVSEKKEPGVLHKISVWVRGNFFIPDARMFWIKPSVAHLKQYLKENPVDVVVSTGPPHSMHLIALALKRELGIKWVADFRDPWTNIDYYQELMLSDRSDKRHHQLEKEVLTTADRVVTIGYTMTQEMKKLGATHVETITNGFDEEDFPSEPVELDENFTISHIGTFSPSRNQPAFWKALAELKLENEEFASKFKFRTVGIVDHQVKTSIEENGLLENWEAIPYVPHDEVLRYQRSSHVLLVSINNTQNATGILPGKFFEYLASGRPILAIGPIESDIGKVLELTQAGMIIEGEDVTGLKDAIRGFFLGTNSVQRDEIQIAKFSRRGLTEEVCKTLQALSV